MTRVSARLFCMAVGLWLALGQSAYAEPIGTMFKYQGQLKAGGVPVDGEYDFLFRLFDTVSGTAQVGSDVWINNWPVSHGLFTVELDFGASVFTGQALWLEVAVRPGESELDPTVLSPRQPLSATPYAAYALSGPGSGGFWSANGSDIYSNNVGNVGIGTSNPVWELEVVNDAPGDGAESGVSADDAGGAMAAYSSTLPSPYEHYAGRVSLFANLLTAGLDLRADAINGDVRFYAGGFAATNERMRLTASGNVGIGTSSPIFKLDVQETDPSVSAAVSGHHTSGYGVKGASDDGIGVIGFGSQQGVYGWGIGENSVGVFGISLGAGGYAGYFNGPGYFGGDLGVNVQDPQATLDVRSFSGGTAVRAVTTGTGVYGLHDSTTGTFPGVWGATDSLETGASGVRGYVNSTSPGPGSAGVRGHNNGTSMNGYGVHGSHAGWGIGALGESVNGIGVYAKSTSNYALYAETTSGSTAARFIGNVEIASPTTGATLIEFGEGLDYAEGFDAAGQGEIAPGTVLVIDAENPGKLAVSDEPYDRKVAGIVAGANGLGSAVRLGAGQFDFDVALAGRVYCNVDASSGAIQPGDLLTTSSTPGYAMKVTQHDQAQGAILGKAMQPLEQGERGQILVLVTLQ